MEGLAAPQECLDFPKEGCEPRSWSSINIRALKLRRTKCVEGRNLTIFSSKGGNLFSLLHVELLDHRIWSADNSLVLALVCNSFKRPLTLVLRSCWSRTEPTEMHDLPWARGSSCKTWTEEPQYSDLVSRPGWSLTLPRLGSCVQPQTQKQPPDDPPL